MSFLDLGSDPYRSLWLMEQAPTAALVLFWTTAAMRTVGPARRVLGAAALGLGGLQLVEVWHVLGGGFPDELFPAGLDAHVAWGAVAAFLAVGWSRRAFGPASVLAGAALGAVGGILAAVAVLGLGVLEERTRGPWVALALGGLVLHALLLGPWALKAFGAMSWFGLSMDGTGLATTLAIGCVQLAAWALLLHAVPESARTQG